MILQGLQKMDDVTNPHQPILIGLKLLSVNSKYSFLTPLPDPTSASTLAPTPFPLLFLLLPAPTSDPSYSYSCSFLVLLLLLPHLDCR